MATTTQTARLRDALLAAGIPREAFRVRVTEAPRGTYGESIAYFKTSAAERAAALDHADELAEAGARVQRFFQGDEFKVAVISCGWNAAGVVDREVGNR